ncbi:ATP synthase F1 subunit epsilon [Candidatus Gottesmanbacteria bacterium]|nr:ATP synthase F1 subunit epsilon [Candidatus Gottesmanbacteria bacterium]
MSSTFLLEIITPDRIAFSDTVDTVTAPSASGIIGILPGHVPLFSRLVEGEIKITKGKEEFFLAIGGGFIEVTGSKVIVLVTDAYHAHEINEQEVLAAQKNAEEALKAKPTGAAIAEAQALFRRSSIALKVLRRKKGFARTNQPVVPS